MEKFILATMSAFFLTACNDSSSSPNTEPEANSSSSIQESNSSSIIASSGSIQESSSSTKVQETRSSSATTPFSNFDTNLSSSQEFRNDVSAPLPDSVEQKILKKQHIEWVYKVAAGLKNAYECETREDFTDEDITTCKQRVCALHPEFDECEYL